MRHGSNGRPARGVSQTGRPPAGWDELDAMPPSLRRAIWEAPVSINPLSVQSLLDDGGPSYARDVLIDSIRREIGAFSFEHRQRHGGPAPGIAAEVAPLSWDAKRGRPIPEDRVRAVGRMRREHR